MKVLLDTHLLLWVASEPEKLSRQAVALIVDPANDPIFSTASIWEIAIKHALGRQDFQADPGIVRRGLLDRGYEELPVLGPHAVAVRNLPFIHKDLFDRILIAQSMVEGITLVTADRVVARYSGSIRLV